jgi:hypothetical protein
LREWVTVADEILALSEWPKLSDRQIAEICAVSSEMVGDVRKKQLSESDSSPEPITRIGRDGKERKMPKRGADEAALLRDLSTLPNDRQSRD